MNCPLCGEKPLAVKAYGFLHSPPLFVHVCANNGTKSYTTDGVGWSYNGLPKEVKFRATKNPETEGSQALTARVFGIFGRNNRQISQPTDPEDAA